MTPAQKTALENLVGRSLSAQEESDIDVFLPDRNDVAIAAILSAGRVKSNKREIGNGTVLEVLGIPSANYLLDAVNTDTNFRYVKPLLEQGRLMIGTSLVRATIKSLVPSVITAEQADALCSLGLDSDPIHYNRVSDVLNVAEGRMTL